MSEWQPIETAPKWPEWVLVSAPNWQKPMILAKGECNSTYRHGSPSVVHWFDGSSDGEWCNADELIWDGNPPTHWQPLPAPPA